MTFMNNTTFGILAHVDAGKTTLSESLLFTAGAIRTRGRVDHGDAFLDTDYDLFENRPLRVRRENLYDPGYAGTCGLFSGNGADTAGTGLRGSCNQRG